MPFRVWKADPDLETYDRDATFTATYHKQMIVTMMLEGAEVSGPPTTSHWEPIIEPGQQHPVGYQKIVRTDDKSYPVTYGDILHEWAEIPVKYIGKTFKAWVADPAGDDDTKITKDVQFTPSYVKQYRIDFVVSSRPEASGGTVNPYIC